MKNLLYLSLLILNSSLHAQSSGFTEPPAVLYGKVVHIDAGSTYEVNSGEMTVTLTSENDVSNSITLTTELAPSGVTGQFSYRLDIPQQYLPSQAQKSDSLSTGETAIQFQFASITIDGIEASPIDTAQSLLTTSFSNRAQEHRLDLAVTLPQLDSDGDSLPDWWEDQYGLNSLFSGDATSDEDGDGWDALTEFNNGSNPTVSNNSVSVRTQKLIAPFEGRLGLYFKVLDSSDTPDAIQFTLSSLPPGFGVVNLQPSFRRLALNDTFTYQDILNGSLFIEIGVLGTAGASASIGFTVSDSESTGTAFTQDIVRWSPLEMDVQEPALWLSANTSPELDLPILTLMDTWQDSSANNRNAYQPDSTKRPFPTNTLGGGGQAINFGLNTSAFFNDSFMYLDDTGLNLEDFTMFCRISPLLFRQFAYLSGKRSILSLNDLELGFEEQANPLASNSIVLRRNGSATYGHALRNDESALITGVGSGTEVMMDLFGQSIGVYSSKVDGTRLEPVFPSIGARVPIATVTPEQHLDMGIGDILLYDRQLDPQTVARIQDYLFTSINAMLWDFSTWSSAVNVSPVSFSRNIIVGGWGNDELSGSSSRDILRGGPGIDRLTGNGQKDVFQFFPDDGNDIILDFDAASGVEADQLDLRGLLSAKTGLPEDYLNLRRVIRHEAGQAPSIDTIVEIDIEADGGLPDMEITLSGIHLQNVDLPRLIGEQIFLLGGPDYELSFAFTTEESQLEETEFARSVTLTRSGNITAATQVILGFTGSATEGADYTLTQVIENGTLRSINFAAGESSKTFDLTPIQDIFPESETIHIAVLPSPQVPKLADSFASLTLEDAPNIQIEALVSHAQRLGQVPGVIRVTRDGDLSEPLDVRLNFSGTARNGEDYVQVSPVVDFQVGEQSKTIEIVPTDHEQFSGRDKLAMLSIVPDTLKYATLSPWSGSVKLVDGFRGTTLDYSSWQELYFPGEVTDLSGANSDGDLVVNLLEYAWGTDPTSTTSLADTQLIIANAEGFLELHIKTASGLSDVEFTVESSSNLVTWTNANDLFQRSISWARNDRILHVFRSLVPVSGLNGGTFYRVSVQQVAPDSDDADVASVLGIPSQSFVSKGASAWVPMDDGSGIRTQVLNNEEESSFVTYFSGPFDISASWLLEGTAGDRLELVVDGTTVATLTDLNLWTPFQWSETSEGMHRVEIILKRGIASNSTETLGSLQQLRIGPPAP